MTMAVMAMAGIFVFMYFGNDERVRQLKGFSFWIILLLMCLSIFSLFTAGVEFLGASFNEIRQDRNVTILVFLGICCYLRVASFFAKLLYEKLYPQSQPDF